MLKLKNNKSSKGFTLVELLSVLAILSIVIATVVTVVLSVINSSETKGFKVTINNVERDASSYVMENNDISLWRDYDDIVEYQCLTVQHLIDKGYYNNDILSSYVSKNKKVKSDDYIYLERDKNSKVINKSILLYEEYDNLIEYCKRLKNSSIIDIEVISGKIVNGYSKEKTVKVTYNVYDGNLSPYKYDFYKNKILSKENNFTDSEIEENVLFDANGDLDAHILRADKEVAYHNVVIENIDNTGPTISENYNGSKIVSGNVTIPIVVNDTESGVDITSFVLGDLDVSIGVSKIDEDYLELKNIGDNNFNLIINDNIHNGDVIIAIDEVCDNLENCSKTTLYPNVKFNNEFNDEYMIKYNSNGGIGTMDDTICVYNQKCSISKNIFTNGDYLFVGWNTKEDGSGTSYPDGYVFDPYIAKNNIILYAQWDLNNTNKVYVKYSVNGGTVKSTTTASDGSVSKWTVDSNGIIYANDTVLTTKIDFGGKTSDSGLYNYNNSQFLKITKKGNSGYENAEWICLEGCSEVNKTFDQTVVYNASDFCDASEGDCTVVLGVNWSINKVTIKYSVNGGTVKSTTTAENGTKYTWKVDSDGIIYRDNKLLSTVINYNESTTDSGLANMNNSKFLKVTRDGYGVYSTKEWICLEGCSNTNKIFDEKSTYKDSDFCDLTNNSCTIVLGVNWYKVSSFKTNGYWYIWSRPGIKWNGVGKSIYYYYEAGGNKKLNCTSYSSCSYQKNYYIGVWQKSKYVYIMMDSSGKYILEDEVARYSNNSGAERVFIRVWIKESDINNGWGCVFNGKNTKYKVGGCDGTLQKMVINGTSYWSAWVPFSCSTKNCPRDEVSIKSFASSMPF